MTTQQLPPGMEPVEGTDPYAAISDAVRCVEETGVLMTAVLSQDTPNAATEVCRRLVIGGARLSAARGDTGIDRLRESVVAQVNTDLFAAYVAGRLGAM